MHILLGVVWAVNLCASCGRTGSGPEPLGLDPVARAAPRIEQAVEEARRHPLRQRPLPAELSREGKVDRLGLIVVRRALVLREPRSDGEPMSQCLAGDYVPILEARNGYAGVRMADGDLGWIEGRQLEVLSEPAAPEVRPEDPEGMRLVATAMKYLGVPYLWGGTTPSGLDCSGFVQRVFAEQGTKLPRVACDQARIGTPVPLGLLEAGDRLYFQAGHEIDHTGIYLGDGRFIHASGSGGAVRIDDFFSEPWQRLYVGARR